MKRENKLDTSAVSRTIEDLNILADPKLSEIISTEQLFSENIKSADITIQNKIHLQIRGYVYYFGGYAEHTRQILFGLKDIDNYCIKLSPINSPINVDPGVLNTINILTKNSNFDIKKSIFLGIAGPGWFQDNEKYIPQDGRYKIAWTMIETLDISDEIISWLNNMNEIWAPTWVDFRKFERISKVMRVMRLGYDSNLYYPEVKSLDIVNLRNRFVFGVFGSWNKRKGVKEIIQAYCRAFNGNDKVSLLFISRYGTRPYDETVGFCGALARKKEELDKWTIKWEIDQILKDMNNDNLPHISIIDVPLHDIVLPHFLKRFNCLVGFSRGESTWLPGLQLMALGKPIIQLASKCSGFMDYLVDNEYLCKNVKYEKAMEEDYLGTSIYYKDQELATGDVLELKEMMLRVYKENYSCMRFFDYHDILKDWTWNKSVSNVDKRLKDIAREISLIV